MDHVKVFKRAWHMVTGYRTLWVFGAILALMTFSFGRAVLLDRITPEADDRGAAITCETADDCTIRLPDYITMSGQPELRHITRDVFESILAAVIVLACIMVVVYIVGKIARYVAEASLIRLVADYEETGERVGVRRGFRVGWSRYAWRLFLINLCIDLTAAVAFILLFALLGVPLIAGIISQGESGLVLALIVATAGFLFLAVFLVIIVSMFLKLLKHFARRVCVLGELRVIESIREGYAMIRRNLKDVGLMWLIMLGVDVGWAAVMIPLGLLLLAVGVLVGGGLALLVRSIAGLLFTGTTAWAIAGVSGVILVVLVLLVALALVEGLLEVFQSSVWTLTYRELCALENMEPEQVPEPAPE